MARELLVAVTFLATVACGVTAPISTPPSSSSPAACYACGTAPGTCTGANCVLNVRDYGASGDGKTDDTKAIQCAIDAASNPKLFPNGAGVYLPPGRYAISIAKAAAKGLSALAIGASNIRLFGDGDSSVLYVPVWEQLSTGLNNAAAYISIGNSSRDVNNVVLERFAFVGKLDATATAPDAAADAVQIGTGLQTFAVNFSGLRDMSFRGTARALGMYGGPVPESAAIPVLRSVGGFVVDSRFTDMAGQVLGLHSAEYVDTLIRGNTVRSVRGLALDIWSGATLIEGNIFDDVRGGAIGFNQDSTSVGWSVVSANTSRTSAREPCRRRRRFSLGRVRRLSAC